LKRSITESSEPEMMAVCGLDCGACDIRLVPSDPEAAKRVVAWFHSMGWLEEGEGVAEIVERGMYCKGCRGDRTVHWSAECPMLLCSIDEKGLEHCGQCDEFVCAKLDSFVRDGGQSHRDAVERLKRLVEARE
jgi:hypothetical protein